MGTYTHTGTEVVSITKNVQLYGGWDGTPSGPVVRDPEAYATTLDGQSARRVVWMDSGLSVTIEGLTITNGTGITEGAGIWSNGSALTISDTIIYSNVAYISGTNGYGGGLYFEDGTLVVDSCTFLHNSAWGVTQSYGGGLYAVGDLDITIRDSLFEANDAWNGSGLYMSGDSSEPLTVDGTTFKDNGRGFSPMASGGYGGGMQVDEANVLIEDSSFLNGWASNEGGAIRFSAGRLVMNRNVIRDNQSHRASGVQIFNSSQFTLTNNIIADNRPGAASSGAVEAGRIGSGNITGLIAHNTLARNYGTYDAYGVLVSSGSVDMVNNIVVSHTVGISTETGATVVTTNTLWGSGDWANGADWGGSGSISHSGDLWGDPAFVDADGGDYHILPASAAMDQGVDAGVTDDIDDDPRPWPGILPDLGADEFWFTPTEDTNLPLVAKRY